MLHKLLLLGLITVPIYGMYEERASLSPHSNNAIALGFHAMNDTDENMIFVMATVMIEQGIRFDEARITYQPTPKDKVRIMPLDGLHTTNDTIVMHFKIPRR